MSLDRSTMDATGHSEYPLAPTTFQVWEFPARYIQTDRSHDRRMGSAQDPMGVGRTPIWPLRKKRPPPAMRRNTGREMLASLLALGQVGLPPTMNTGASLRFARMTYQSAHVATNQCEAEKFALAR